MKQIIRTRPHGPLEPKKPLAPTALDVGELARVTGGQGVVAQGPGTPAGIGTSPSGDGVGTTPS